MAKQLKYFIFSIMLCACSPVFAVNLATSPIFLGSQIPPNVFFLLDDSGSMDWEILTTQHWFKCSYDPYADDDGVFKSSNCGRYDKTGFLYVRSGTYNRDRLSYLYQNTDNTYGNCQYSYSFSPGCNNQDDWRLYSSDLNVVFYNPSVTYAPWRGPCYLNENTCTDASFTSARANPREGETGYTLTRDLSGFSYNVWIDDRGFSGSRPNRGSNTDATSTANEIVDYWDAYLHITLNTGPAVQVQKITFSPNSSGLNQSTTTLGTLNNTSSCYNVLGTQALARQVFDNTLAYNSTGETGCRTIAEARQNVANWYEFARKRSFAAKSALTDVIQNSPGMRYGITLSKNQSLLFKEVPQGTDYTTHNTQLLAEVYSYNWLGASTPLRDGLYQVGKYFQGDRTDTTDPITHACQQNFAIVLSDGQWNGTVDIPEFSDVDGDGVNRTFADIAYYFYSTDLSDLDNLVPGNARDNLNTQHLVTFAATFGISGNLVDTDDDGWPNPTLTESSDWGNPYYNSPARVDDVWHGAYNARGTYVAAQTPEAVSVELQSVLSDIKTRIASAASVAQNSSILTADTYVYQTQFNSGDWRGHLLAYGISESGLASYATWDAGCRLTGGTCATALNPSSGIAPNSRVILTYNPTENRGVPFRFPSNYSNPAITEMSSSQVTSLLVDVTSNQQTEGENRVDYLRGDRSNEVQNGGTYRNRVSILGDFVNSSPDYVGPPDKRYPDDLEASAYSTFKSTYANRPSVIYVGANDGMLHGFDVATGDERMAYVPGTRQIYDQLRYLLDTNYFHRYFVDGSPTVADAYVGGAWKTILAGTLNGGGQAVYFLDVTDPVNFSESAANNIVIGEFTDEDDARLGYSYSKPQIAKMADGRWAVIIGNGYNSSQADGFAAANDKAVLFILFLGGGNDGTWTAGTDYIALEVGSSTTDNGLATPALADTNGDYRVDTIYAGDLNGGLWRFDVSSSDTSSWSSSKLFDAGKPITAKPVIGRHPDSGVLVYFATGKYLGFDDNVTDISYTNSLYAIWDKESGAQVLENNLLEQTILGEVSVNGANVRLTSNNPIDWALYDGWKMDLTAGERVVATPILRSNRIIFTTLIPASASCSFGGSSWLMELNAYTGTRLAATPFDINNDLIFNISDWVDADQINGVENAGVITTSGIQSPTGLSARPTILITPDRAREVKVISGSGGLGTVDENPGDLTTGRQNWRRLR